MSPNWAGAYLLSKWVCRTSIHYLQVLKSFIMSGLGVVIVHAGADIDAVGFVFLQNVSATVLYNVTYSGIPTDQACPTFSSQV